MTDSTPTLPETTAIGRSALRVADLDTVGDFYETVVGLEFLARTEAGCTLGVDGRPILELRADPAAPDRHPESAGLYHNAFRVPTRGALGDALGRIREGWTLDGAADHGVSEAIYLADPEGNGVEIYRDRPREEWPIDDDGRVRMDSRRLDLDGLLDDAATFDAGAVADAVDAGGDSRAPPGTDLGHVHLEVSSLGPAREFYVDALGLRIRQELPGSALFLAAGDYHHHVGLNTWNGRSRPPEGRGLAWFEVVLPDVEALDAARTRLEDGGYAVENVGDGSAGAVGDTTPTGFRVIDPDGIEIRLRAGE